MQRDPEIKYTFYAEDGTFVTAVVIGEGMDSGDKATNKAMSIAFKYALFQIFCIPTEEMADPDSESPEPAPKGKANKAAKESDKKAEHKQEQPSQLRFDILVALELVLIEHNRHGRILRDIRNLAEFLLFQKSVDSFLPKKPDNCLHCSDDIKINLQRYGFLSTFS